MEETEAALLNAEDIEKSTVEEKKHEVLKVRDYAENMREFAGLVKENYLTDMLFTPRK